MIHYGRFDGDRAIRGLRPPPRNPVLEHANKYSAKKWAAFPLQPRSKLPVFLEPEQSDGHSYISSSFDKNVINQWFEEHPEFNIGIATGRNSGVFVLDVDGADGEESLEKLEWKHGRLPETAEVRTGKGRHIYFQNVPGIKSSVAQLAPYLDIRGDDGYVVAPPSVHENGHVYSWTREDPIRKAPDWLVEKVINVDYDKQFGRKG